MPATTLAQLEADALIGMEKHRENDEELDFPGLGDSISVPLVSADGRERFLLDARRHRACSGGLRRTSAPKPGRRLGSISPSAPLPRGFRTEMGHSASRCLIPEPE